MKKKILAVGLTLTLTLGSVSSVFAASDPWGNWDSTSGYPKDIVNTQYFAPVKSLMDRKIISGYPDGTYKPDNNMIRADFAAIMARATNNMQGVGGGKSDFDDLAGLPSSYDDCINGVTRANIMSGVGNRKFAPYNNISYAEVITAIIRTKNAGIQQYVNGLGKWPDNYISYAQMYNMLGDVVVRDWNAPATRGDIAKLTYRNMPKAAAGSASITGLPTADTAIINVAKSFTATVTGKGTHDFAWYVDGNIVPYAVANTLTYTFATAKTYKVKLVVTTTETGKNASSSTAEITVTVL